MFTPTELQFIRKKSPTDFDALLSRLAIAIDNTIDDEDKLYEKIDDDLTRKLSALMKSSSVIAGYTTLLELGGIVYDYSETDNELLAKIVANREKILDAVRTQAAQYNNQAATYDSWQNEYGNTAPESELVERLKISVADAKPFRLDSVTYNLRRARTLLRDKRDDTTVSTINYCINELETSTNLFKVSDKKSYFESGDELIKEIFDRLNVGYSMTLNLRISKTVERRAKKIPPAPDKPSVPLFTVRKAEDVLDILEQLNHVVSAKG